MKRLMIIVLALAVYASLETGTKAEYDLKSTDWYQQENASVQANVTDVEEHGGVRAKSSPTNDEDRVNAQASDDEDGNGGDDDDGDDNGDENGKGPGFDRMWDVAEFG
jgi:hypothetical protein